MPLKKTVTLNKAASMMKKVKDITKNNEARRSYLVHPIDAISGKNPSLIQKELIKKIEFMKATAIESEQAILFFSELKEAIIEANVKSGLHRILCQIDMIKNQQDFLQSLIRIDASKVVQDYAQNSRGLQHILVKEDSITEQIVFNSFVKDIVEDITRQDSKNSYVNTVIDIDGHDAESLQKSFNILTKAINDLEDKKYQINNSYKIDILIPDALADSLGISA